MVFSLSIFKVKAANWRRWVPPGLQGHRLQGNISYSSPDSWGWHQAPMPSTMQAYRDQQCNPRLLVFPCFKITHLSSHTLVIFFKFTEAETNSAQLQWVNFSQFLLAERVDKPELRDCLRARKALHHTRYLPIALFDDLAKQQQEADTRKRNLIPMLVIYELL